MLQNFLNLQKETQFGKNKNGLITKTYTQPSATQCHITDRFVI